MILLDPPGPCNSHLNPTQLQILHCQQSTKLPFCHGCFSARGSQAQGRQEVKGGRSEGEGIAENFIAIEGQKNPAPPLCCCQGFCVRALWKPLPVQGVWGWGGVAEMFLGLLSGRRNGNNNVALVLFCAGFFP